MLNHADGSLSYFRAISQTRISRDSGWQLKVYLPAKKNEIYEQEKIIGEKVKLSSFNISLTCNIK